MKAVYVEKNLPRMLAVKALRGLWPGVIWSPISPAHIVDLPEPVLPGARWVRVRTRQCGICATDLSLLKVKADPSVAPAALPGNTRFYLGHEVIGEIVEVGPQVDRFSLGDRVVMESRFVGPNCLTQEIDPPCPYCASGQTRLCENASVGLGPAGAGGGWGDSYTAHEEELWPIPDDLDDDQASLVEPMSVALHGVLRRPPGPDDHALVIGAGIIGLLTLQAIKIVEPLAHVTVMARYPHQVAAAERLGADRVISDRDPYPAVAEVSGGKLYNAPLNRGMILGGFERIFDCVGSVDTVYNALRWARAGGAVVLVGIQLGEMKIDLNPVWYQEVDLIGSNTFGVEHWRGSAIHTFDLVIEMLQEGVLIHQGLITHRFPLGEVKRAIETANDKASGAIKVSLMTQRTRADETT
jgi:threonine dehydrogenase-like Zn-dependent dehydrogenase